MNNELRLTLDRRAVSPEELQKLSTNFIDIISDCEGIEDFSVRNELQDYYPLASWLMNTSLARLIRERSRDPQKFHKSEEGVDWEMDLPGAVWTLAPSNSGDDCCWTMPDFAKCSTSVPLFLLCLKDCDKIFDKLVMERLQINSATDLAGIARSGESVERVNERLRIMWFAFYLAHTMVLGTSTTSDNITKPFHGLYEVLQNNAVVSIDGTNPLAAFRSIGCRLDVLGGLSGFTFWANPLIRASIREMIVPDESGRYPTDWSRNGDEIYFKGIPVREDKLVPVDMTNGTGDVWLLAGDAVGAFFAYNLNDPYIVEDDFTEETKANGCAQLCTYLYNFGTVASNNANRLMVISGVPISNACTEIADLAGLINPQTLIPAV